MSHPQRYGWCHRLELEPTDDGPYILASDYIEAMAELDTLRREKHAQQWNEKVGELERRAFISEGAAIGLRRQIESLKTQLAVAWDANKRMTAKVEATRKFLKSRVSDLIVP